MVTVGFCGSCTSYSTWIMRVFQGFSNQLHFNRHGLHNVMDAFTQTGATLGVSIAALYAGGALANFLDLAAVLRTRSDSRAADAGDDKGASARHTLFDAGAIALGLVFWAAAAVLCGTYPPFRTVTFALVMAPPGAVLRWYLARMNVSSSYENPIRARLLYRVSRGTLTANLIAITLLSAAQTGMYVGYARGLASLGAHSALGCAALSGFQNGFCGCLSTVSTFAVELVTLKPHRIACAYAFVSWAAGLAICVLLFGVPWWTLGMQGGCSK